MTRFTNKAARVLLAATLASAGLLAVVSVSASAASPNMTLTESAPATAMYGTAVTATLSVTNPTSGPGTPMYNLTYTDVLPVGVSYVSGSSTTNGAAGSAALGDPEKFSNEPSTGQTTLIWSNVADLEPSSTESISFNVQPATDHGTYEAASPVYPGESYTDSSAVYANTDPRYVPEFSGTGTPISGPDSYTDFSTSAATTSIVALTDASSEPSPKGEILRGVHDNQIDYTVTVTNNDVWATNGVVVTDYLPADLEFLGCGGVDNTTNAVGTNPGSTDEYPGSGSLDVSTATSDCPTPVSVATVTDPTSQGGTLSGVYTAVTWDITSLSASQVDSFKFVAGIPLRSNTDDWSGTLPVGNVEPSASSLGQEANLDNNTGAETYDGEAVETIVDASGSFSGTLGGSASNPVASEATNTGKAVDLAEEKSVSTPTFRGGQYVTYSLNYQTSEYRYTTNAVLTDTIPSGLCPIGPANYATDSDASECTPSGGKAPSVSYTSVAENPDGSFALTWDLGTLPADSSASVTYPVLDRAYYQGPDSGSIVQTTPTLISDGFTNNSQITGTINGACYDGVVPTTTYDATCSGLSPTILYGGETTPATATESDSATQTAPTPTVSKTVAFGNANPATPVDCATATYTSRTVSETPSTTPFYQLGDTVCYDLEVTFPAGVYAHDPVVTDFLPPNMTYVANSATSTGDNTATIASTTDSSTSPDSIVFDLGDPQAGDSGLYTSPGQVFDETIEAVVTAPPAEGNNYTILSNLMTLSALNTQGQSVSLRSSANFYLTQPVIESLAKAVTEDNGSAPGAHVEDSDVLTYNLTITNDGLLPAKNTTVWDSLPSAITDCSTSTSSISDSGTCGTATQLQWTGVAVPAATFNSTTQDLVPGTYTLSYDMTVPATAAAAQTLTNNAGVVSYQSPAPNNGSSATPQTYYPASNIDAAVTSSNSNAPAANASASVSLATDTLTKTASPVVNGQTVGGNPAATDGEPVLYTVTATIPAGVSMYSPTLTDAIPSGLTYSSTPAAASATVNGVNATTDGFSLVTAPGSVTLDFPSGPYQTAPGTPVTIVLSYYAIVHNENRGTVITNSASLAWNTSSGSPTTVSASAKVTVITPEFAISKTDAPGGPYAPGATVTYTIHLTNNGTDAENSYNTVVTDTLPTGVTGPACGTTPTNWSCTVNGTTSIVYDYTGPYYAANSGTTLFTYTTDMPNPAVADSSVVNDVSVTGNSLNSSSYTLDVNSPTVTNSDTVKITGPTISKVASPTSVTNGVDTTYTVTVNVPAGPELPDLTVIDTLPNGMTFDSYGANNTDTCTDTAGSCGADVQTQSIGAPIMASNGTTSLGWWIGNLADDSGARTITFTYTAYPSEKYNNGTGSSVTPTTLTNDVAEYWNNTDAGAPPVGSSVPLASTFTYSSTVATTPLSVVAPDLVITKVPSTTAPTPGVPFDYTITVQNNGTVPAYGATVSDDLPTGLNFTDSSIASASEGTPSYNAGSGDFSWDLSGVVFAPGDSATLSIVTQLAPSSDLPNSGTIINTATINQYYAVPTATATADLSRYIMYGPTSVSAPISVSAVFPAPMVTKTMPNGPTAVVGTPFTWHLAITDDSTAASTATSVTDTLPAYWTYVSGVNTTTITEANATVLSGLSADPVVTYNSGTHVDTLTWSGSQLGDLSASEANSISVAYTATPNVGVGHTNTNSAYANVDDITGASGNASGLYVSNTATSSAIIQTADLTITKTIGSSGLEAGSATDVYDINVSNAGPDAAANLTVTDTAPTGTTFTGSTSSGWSCVLGSQDESVVCTYGSLASGSSATELVLGIDVPPSYITTYPTGLITNTATVSTTTNDVASPSQLTSTAVGNVSQGADLEIVKTHTGNFAAGADGVYHLSITNNGPSDSSGPVTVTDTLPTGEAYVSTSSADAWGCTDFAQVVTCTLSTGLLSGQVSLISLTVAVPSNEAPGSLTNVATVAGPLTDPLPSNNTSSDPTTIVDSADLSITKTATGGFVVGSDGTYALSITNNGPSDAAAPTVLDTIPTGETFVSAAGTGWTCGDVGALLTCNYNTSLTSGTTAAAIDLRVAVGQTALPSVSNTATVSSTTPDPHLANNTSTVVTPVTLKPVAADLVIVKTGPSNLTVGENATYTLAVTNNGPASANAPVVSDALPAGETFVSASGTGWTCDDSSQTVTCTFTGSLSAGPAPAIAVVVAVGAAAYPSVTNTATVSSSSPDPVLTNNTSSVQSSVASQADLAIVKTNKPTGLVQGGTVTYLLKVTNNGPTADPGPVTVTDDLPSYESFVSATAPGWSCEEAAAIVTCVYASSVASGYTSTIVLKVRLSQAAPATVVNTASVKGTGTDPNLANNHSTDVIKGVASATTTTARPGTVIPKGAPQTGLGDSVPAPLPVKGALGVLALLLAGLSLVGLAKRRRA
jgi:large repetitive protein